jgi:hypothetical protein
MTFETGKFYEHYGLIEQLAIVGEFDTHLYGKALMAECIDQDGNHEFRAVGMDEESAMNYFEITELEWRQCFAPSYGPFCPYGNKELMPCTSESISCSECEPMTLSNTEILAALSAQSINHFEDLL